MFEELEMDTDFLYLALAEKELEDCIRPEKKESGSTCDSRIVPIFLQLMQSQTSSTEGAVTSTENKTRESLEGFLRFSSEVSELTITLLQHTNKLRKDFLFSPKKDSGD